MGPKALELDALDDGLGGAVIRVSVAELHAGERMVHHNGGAAVRKIAVMLLLAHRGVREQQVLLRCAAGRGIEREGDLLVGIVRVGNAGRRGGHAEIEINRGLLVRPRVGGTVVVPVAPATVDHILVHPLEIGLTESLGITVHAHGLVNLTDVERIGRDTPRGGGGVIHLLDGLLQADLAVQLDRQPLLRRHGVRGAGRVTLKGERNVVLPQRGRILEILLPLAGGKCNGSKGRNHEVDSFHNFQSLKG